LIGTWPGLKPCIFTVRASFFSRVAISASMRSTGIETVMLRSRVARVLDSLLH
jgi:hypothetical protein